MSIKRINGYMTVNHKTTKQSEKNFCFKCKKELTPKETFFHVDGSNYAITNNASMYCKDCCIEAKEKAEKHEKEMAIIGSVIEAKPPEERRKFIADLIKKYITT